MRGWAHFQKAPGREYHWKTMKLTITSRDNDTNVFHQSRRETLQEWSSWVEPCWKMSRCCGELSTLLRRSYRPGRLERRRPVVNKSHEKCKHYRQEPTSTLTRLNSYCYSKTDTWCKPIRHKSECDVSVIISRRHIPNSPFAVYDTVRAMIANHFLDSTRTEFAMNQKQLLNFISFHLPVHSSLFCNGFLFIGLNIISIKFENV